MANRPTQAFDRIEKFDEIAKLCRSYFPDSTMDDFGGRKEAHNKLYIGLIGFKTQLLAECGEMIRQDKILPDQISRPDEPQG